MPKLGEIADLRMGYPFRGRILRIEQGACGLVQMPDVDARRGRVSEVSAFVHPVPPNVNDHALHVGDVLIVSRGVRNDAATFVAAADQVIASPHLAVVRPTRVEFPDYLTWFLNLPDTQEHLRSLQRGSAVPFLALDALRNLEVPLPGTEVQNSIIELYRLQLREVEILRDLSDQRQALLDGLMLQAARGLTNN